MKGKSSKERKWSKSFMRKYSADFFLFLILLSITMSFFIIFHDRRIQFERDMEYINKSEYESRDLIPFHEVFDFIEEHVEKDSMVLFLELKYFQWGKPYLYPEISTRLFYYSNDTDDQEFIDFLKENSIDDILVSIEPTSSFWNSIYFTNVANYTDQIYLLKVETDEL